MKITDHILEYLLESALKNIYNTSTEKALEEYALNFLEGENITYDPNSGETAFQTALDEGMSADIAHEYVQYERGCNNIRFRDITKASIKDKADKSGIIDLKQHCEAIFKTFLELMDKDLIFLAKMRNLMNSSDFKIDTRIYEDEIKTLSNAIDQYLDLKCSES